MINKFVDKRSFWSLDRIRKVDLNGYVKNSKWQFLGNNYVSRKEDVMRLISRLNNYLQNNAYIKKARCSSVGKFFLKNTYNMRLSRMKAKIAYLAMQELADGVDKELVKQKVMWASEYYRKQYTELVVLKSAVMRVIKDTGSLEAIFGITNRLPCYDYCVMENDFTKGNPYFESDLNVAEMQDMSAQIN